ncbi:AMP-binding protein [Roseateles sp.]|uniref:AMP-binding enzyme n=1 Tax=Roseateles sp. TaxID=1971397 RepID=UPI0037C77C8E
MQRSLISKLLAQHKIDVRHGWGMTETTGAATINVLNSAQRQLPVPEQAQLLSRQGRSLFGIDLKVIDESGTSVPRDGRSQGELMVRGHWIMEKYHKVDEPAHKDGWLPTGDIATLDADGFMQIRDRAKDLVKSGGEWISSQSLEEAAMDHPSVALAAVIGVPHPKWDERPLMFVKCKPGHALDKSDLLLALSKVLPRWWLPDEIRFVTELPIGGTGKVLKGRLRELYAEDASEVARARERSL